MAAARFLRPLRRGAGPLALVLALAPFAAGTGHAQGAAPQATSPYLEPAPGVFEASGTALWDGKRTLQGIWVAHPDATSARRVRIFNTETGTAVDGALFKRDAALSGPSVLISSEAAQLLGMEAGEEAELRIVAVTPVQTEPAAPPAVQAPGGAAAPVVPEPAAPQAEAAPAASPTPAPAVAAPAPDAEPDAAATAGTVALTTPAADAAPALQPVPQPAPAAVPEAAPAPAAAAAGRAAGQRPAPQGAPPIPPAETFTLPDPAAATAPAAERTAAASPLSRPYVQAGLFGVERNARRLIGRLEEADLPALGKPMRLNGRPVTRVLAGPFLTEAERDAALRTIRGMGLRDATPVAR